MSSADPAMSVVLVAAERYDTLRRTMSYLRRQTIAEELEIIVASPKPEGIVVDVEDQNTFHSVRVTKASGALVGGPSVNVLTRNACCTASQVILDVVYTFFNGGPDGPRFFASNNFAMARQRFHELGGFDVNFYLAACEDRDFCDRWRHHGLPLVYAHEAIVDHAHPLTLGKFYRQHYNYGRGAFIYHQLRKKRQSGRMRDDMGLHFRMPALLREPMSKLSWSMAARVLALLCVWQFANAHGFFVEKCQVRKKPHLPDASG